MDRTTDPLTLPTRTALGTNDFVEVFSPDAERGKIAASEIGGGGGNLESSGTLTEGDVAELSSSKVVASGIPTSDIARLSEGVDIDTLGLAGSGAPMTLTESLIASGSAVSLTTDTVANVTSLSLAAGTYEIQSNAVFSHNASTCTAVRSGINTTSATLPATVERCANTLVGWTTTSGAHTLPIPGRRVVLATPGTVYLCVSATFSAGTVVAFGYLRALQIA